MGFLLGDRVLSHAPDNIYAITYEGWEGYVTAIEDPLLPDNYKCDIRVSENPDDGFEGYLVESKYFENLSEGEREDITVSCDELLAMVFGSEVEDNA